MTAVILSCHYDMSKYTYLFFKHLKTSVFLYSLHELLEKGISKWHFETSAMKQCED